eukprot:m.75984 g.75984  ORF g.75984 m.75984 type:complete len:409 (+) comp12535_c1_seq2:231-1457(+)
MITIIFTYFLTTILSCAALSTDPGVMSSPTGSLILSGRDIVLQDPTQPVPSQTEVSLYEVLRNITLAVEFAENVNKSANDRITSSIEYIQNVNKSTNDRITSSIEYTENVNKTTSDRISSLVKYVDNVNKTTNNQIMSSIEYIENVNRTTNDRITSFISDQMNTNKMSQENDTMLQLQIEGMQDNYDSLLKNYSKLMDAVETLTTRLNNMDQNGQIFHYDFETLFVGGSRVLLGEGRWVHFTDTGNSGLSGPVSIPPWRATGQSGVYNSNKNEISKFGGTPGTHTLFINNGVVYTILPFYVTKTQNMTLTMNVGGGNGNSDGGYQIIVSSFPDSDPTKQFEIAKFIAGENGAPNTKNDGTYSSVQFRFDTTKLPDEQVGNHVRLTLGRSKNSQAHVHFVHLNVGSINV